LKGTAPLETSQAETERADTRPRNPVTTPLKEKPRWLIDVEIAKAKVFDALSLEERAEAKAAQMAARERREQRKKTTMARAKLIFAMHDDGRTAYEIAAASARGVTIAYSASFVRRTARPTIEREGALRRLAADCGKTPAQALEDLIAFALDDDTAIGRRTLHVRRQAD
jgi:hypothetical protein